MTISSDLFLALKGLVGNRCYPDTFPQEEAAPVWPAIRYTFISGEIASDICGDGTEETDSPRIQIDAAAETDTERDQLRIAIRAAMAAFSPPAIMQGSPRQDYDSETKTFGVSMDYFVHGSSS